MHQRRAVVALLLVVVAAVVAAIVLLTGGPEKSPAPAAAADGVAPAEKEHAAPAEKAKKGRARDAGVRWERKGPGTVVGTVREYGSDRPVADAELSLEAGLPGPNELLHTRSRADGGFTFEKVTNFDAWMLRAKAPPPLADAELAGIAVIENRATDVGSVYLAPAFVVPGEVVDERSAPVPGATVRAVRERPASRSLDFLRIIRELPARPAAVDQATCGEDGKFKLSKVPPGTYDFIVEKSGFEIKVVEGLLVTPDAKDHPLRLVVSHGFTLDGVVKREGDGPLANLPVVAFHTPRDQTDWSVLDKSFTATDEKGAFHLDGLGAGRYVVAVTPENEPFTVDTDVDVPSKKPVELLIRGDAWLDGRVTGEDDKPVGGAQVFAAAATGNGSRPTVGAVQTDAEGRYAIRGLHSGKLELFLVQAQGYGTYPEDLIKQFRGGGLSISLTPGHNQKDVKLARGGVVRGIVKEKGTENLIAGARVELTTPLAMFGGKLGATSGADGRFEITSAPRGTAVLLVTKDGWFWPGVSPTAALMVLGSRMQGGSGGPDPGKGSTVEIGEPGQVVERVIELSHGSTIKGRVLNPAGEPMPGAQVSLVLDLGGGMMRQMASFLPNPEPRMTDEKGEYDLAGPAPGQKARVVARAQGFLDGRSDLFAAGPGEEKGGVDVKVRVGATITGRVHDAKGLPVEGAMVRWLDIGESGRDWSVTWRLRSATPSLTDAKGTFSIVNVETSKLVVQVTHAQYLSWSSPDVESEEGKPLELDVALEAGAVIEGRVLGSDGRPQAGANVRLDLEGTKPEGTDPYLDANVSVATDGAGEFRAEGLLPGTYAVRASAEGSAPSEPVDVGSGGPSVTLHLAHAFTISGTVRLKSGGPVADVWIVATRKRAAAAGGAPTEGTADVVDVQAGRDRSDAQGAFEIRNLPAGTYALAIEQMWGSGKANVIPTTLADVEAGRQGVVLECDAGLTIEGVVILESGEPAGGGYVYANYQPAPGEKVEGNGWVNDQMEEGKFRLVGLRAGKWAVTINPENAPARSMIVEAGTKDLRVELAGGGSVKGRVVRADGSAAGGIYISVHGGNVSVSHMADEKGEFEIKGVPEGTCTIDASLWADNALKEHAHVENVAVRKGSATEVELRCETVAPPPK